MTTIATTTFLKLNQSHFNQAGIDYQQPNSASDANDFYQHHHFPYHAFPITQYYPPHMHCTPPSQHCDHHAYGTTSGKSYAHHTYQTIGPSTISSTLYHDQHHYAKPDNMGNIEIIETKKPRAYDEMNNEI